MSIYSDVRTLIGEPSGGIYYTTAHVCNAINEALLYVYGRHKHKSFDTTISFGVGADIVTIPTTLYIPRMITLDNKQWFPTTYARLEQHDQYWRTATSGQPKWFVLRQWNKLQCWPKPDTTYTFHINGIPYPSEIDGVTVVDTNDDQLVKSAIVYRAAASLVEHDFPQISDYFAAQATEYCLKANVELRNAQPHNLRRIRPGTVFTNAQSGSISIGKRVNY